MESVINDALEQVVRDLKSGDPAVKPKACRLLDRLLDEQVPDDSAMDYGQFPKDDTEWFGALVQLTPAGQQVPQAHLACQRENARLTLGEDLGLRVRVHLQPAGGETELYDTDWRTLPFLDCPEMTLWPGELAVP